MLSNDKLDAIREDWQMKYDHDISMCNDYIKDLESKIERLRGALAHVREYIAGCEYCSDALAKVDEALDGEYFEHLRKENQRLRDALEEIREYERIVHAGSKLWSIANKALAGETK